MPQIITDYCSLFLRIFIKGWYYSKEINTFMQSAFFTWIVDHTIQMGTFPDVRIHFEFLYKKPGCSGFFNGKRKIDFLAHKNQNNQKKNNTKTMSRSKVKCFKFWDKMKIICNLFYEPKSTGFHLQTGHCSTYRIYD